MIDLAAYSPPVQAALLVGAVLVESIVLYVGYGAVEQVAADPIIERIKNA